MKFAHGINSINHNFTYRLATLFNEPQDERVWLAGQVSRAILSAL
jgi:hypothetical protein